MNRTELTDLLSKAKAATEDNYLKIIQEWKHAWMNQYSNGHADHDNYFRRAFGIDANMKHSLAKLLMENSVPTEAITRLAESYLEALEALEFYADIENWSLSEKHTSELNEGSKHSIIGGYTRIWGDHSDGGINLIGGKRAREFLRKIGET